MCIEFAGLKPAVSSIVKKSLMKLRKFKETNFLTVAAKSVVVFA